MMATNAKKQPAVIDEAAKAKQEKDKAKTNLSSAINAAAVIEAYRKSVFGEQQGGLIEVYEELNGSIKKLWGGDLKKCEAMLLSQAVALQSIFTNLSRRAINQDYLKQMDAYLRLGLKAQAQAVRTIEALAEMKNPRSVAFVKQANIANNQQVNNGQISQAENFENQQSKLSGERYELFENTGAQSIASGINPALETVGEIDRAEIRSGQGEGVTERLQGRLA
ncbi:MAG: hypothetical protein J0M13_09235 [Candidatus Accumulibacter sp.]|jgi:hypothetical protein|nr:hypothetical protein [Candidatus Accumulibacter necessarius]